MVNPDPWVLVDMHRLPYGLWEMTLQAPDRRLHKLIIDETLLTVFNVQLSADVVCNIIEHEG